MKGEEIPRNYLPRLQPVRFPFCVPVSGEGTCIGDDELAENAPAHVIATIAAQKPSASVERRSGQSHRGALLRTHVARVHREA